MKNLEYFNKNGNSCLVNLGVKVNPFPETKEALEVVNTSARGVRWEFEGRKIVIFDDRFVRGYPCSNLSSFIAIYPQSSVKYPPPSNAVVLNPDGTVRLRLSPPELISKLALERMSPAEINERNGLWFQQAFWNIDNNGTVVTSMWIGFRRDWFEERVLDPVTGEFGACLNSGRI